MHCSNQNTSTIEFHLQIPDHLSNERFDKALSSLLPDYSRERIKHWIQQGWVHLNQKPFTQVRYRLQGGETIDILGIEPTASTLSAEDVDFEIMFADFHLIIINKPAHVVVHPGAGCARGTLINGLIKVFPELQQLPRAGLIHRLDKGTSGLLLVARTLPIYTKLMQEMQLRKIKREYIALAYGKVISAGTIDAPIGRHPRLRTQMAVVNNGRPAITHYRILERFTDFTLLLVQLETGRTHQIRVHFSHHNHSIVGDPSYGIMRFPQRYYSTNFLTALHTLKRQALHAYRLSFMHPVLKSLLKIECPIPEDINDLLDLLRIHEKQQKK